MVTIDHKEDEEENGEEDGDYVTVKPWKEEPQAACIWSRSEPSASLIPSQPQHPVTRHYHPHY